MTIGAKSRFSLALLLIIAFAAGILSATVGGNWVGVGDRIGTPSLAATGSGLTPTDDPLPLDAEAAAFEDAFVNVAELVNPTVVQIRSSQVREVQYNNPFEGSPFENWFRMPDGQQQQQQTYRTQALGSGVIVREDGYIVTNFHVIRQADELEVLLYDGTFHEATVVGSDEESDLAVIRIDTDGLPAAALGSMDEVRVGEWVLAFGSPLSEDLGNTVTSGIVSAIGRTSRNLSSLNLFASFIQTDAAINPGNSGGPLVDLHGRLIGINSAIMSRSGGYQGVGFAIPVDVVRNVADQLIDNGAVERGFLGVNFDAVTPSLAEAFDVPRGAAQVTRVTEDSPAQAAGLEEGDIITAVNGRELRSAEELRTTVGNMPPGASVELTTVRGGDRRVVSVELGRRSEFVEQAASAPSDERPDSPDDVSALGMTLQTLSEAAAQRYGSAGVLVSAVDVESEAYRQAEIRQGDVIVEADRRPVTSLAEFQEVYRGIDSGETFIVKVLRIEGQQIRTYFTALSKP